MELDKSLKVDFLSEIKGIIQQARTNAVRSVDFCRVQMYWTLGKRIFEEEQDGKERADYGAYLLKNLSKELVPEFGSGFSYRQLAFCRQFYKTYPIVNALRSQFNWTQYRLLIQIDNPDKREYYELEAMNNCWTARELERQINSGLYERLLLSNDKEAVLAVARSIVPTFKKVDTIRKTPNMISVKEPPFVSIMSDTNQKKLFFSNSGVAFQASNEKGANVQSV